MPYVNFNLHKKNRKKIQERFSYILVFAPLPN